MPLSNINPTQTKAWQKLTEIYQAENQQSILQHFQNDKHRTDNFYVQFEDLHFDFSKNRLSQKAFDALVELADEVNLKSAIKAQYSGEPINQTENRPVLHTALRTKDEVKIDEEPLNKLVEDTKVRMSEFVQKVENGQWKGFSGKPITDVVNIGIGGSDLGPQMIVEALSFYHNHLKTHFISNVDGDHVAETLKNLNPETTLCIVVSKSFTTQETLTNASTVRSWFLKHTTKNQIQHHFVAVSANIVKANEFGISSDNIFPMWDWVGGRFSLWSAAGLSIACAVGFKPFEELLHGAQQMDEHFQSEDLSNNIPVILALLGVWYNNFYNAESEAIIPYTQYLEKLAPYLQQASMESNGKGIDRNGQPVDYQTGTIVWGEPGTNAQHAFFQLMHQGTKLIPADFIGFKKPLNQYQDHHDILMANFFAQTEALMNGKSEAVVKDELKNQGLNSEQIQTLTPFKVFSGNRPTNTIIFDKLTPKSLGMLIAMYEHKIFVQGVIWNIFSYDQWGVELGKQLAKNVLKDFKEKEIITHDLSTSKLIDYYKN
ncbi:glucose-6-phosphate isomerase [Mesohalobacter halotolerans]|uniref:Glucose-6-phosphate isomerase n=1 Tax=Mesohalobacter halotolerans TaxID=1883405 RepID=A0A4U5TRB6_9FLAO|nr:glucose-6-phosphate isomerase [Mesohalobacter halotolerans]MBS3738307.1 glucose-6-phosphate isomerase [Psychroflexus sp.]TKS55924.1 glucose-6-phosphate isomerase [Mesohalobacter halotolerans]